MPDPKLLAGHAVRRFRRGAGLTQAAMAERLGISPSYLNLVERNQRPVSAALLLRLVQVFDFDPRALAASEPGGGAEAMRRRLADPLFADLEIDRAELEAWLAAAPTGAEAFARVFDRGSATIGDLAKGADPVADVRRAIERWRNHFADLDATAETLADELRAGGGDPYGAMADRLRVRHKLLVRVLPVETMPTLLQRLDTHARQLQLSERLDPASRVFALAQALASEEARGEIDALVRGAELADRAAQRLFRRHLTGYFAAAVMMPYARFHRACEATGYDVELLQRRFGAGFEQVAHRLTTMQRVGQRGLPFFMMRVDRAGQVSKRYAGASNSPLVEGPGLCPLWRLFDAFARPGELVTHLVEVDRDTRWFTMARTVSPSAATFGTVRARFAVVLGLAADAAASLAAARGLDLANSGTPIGRGCRACLREACPQRSAPPTGRALLFNDREAGLTPFTFARD